MCCLFLKMCPSTSYRDFIHAYGCFSLKECNYNRSFSSLQTLVWPCEQHCSTASRDTKLTSVTSSRDVIQDTLEMKCVIFSHRNMDVLLEMSGCHPPSRKCCTNITQSKYQEHLQVTGNQMNEPNYNYYLLYFQHDKNTSNCSEIG